MIDWLLALLLGPLLWLVGAIVFDGVHALLHAMLRSRHGLLRALAWPHAVHHRWIDAHLETDWSLRTANVWCHIVPEYMTQLVYTALLLWLLPWPCAAVVLVLQTSVFGFILSTRGRDVNHRPTPRIDAHPPGWSTPPAYHLLHHVWPDAYYSAYTKVVDRLLGTATQISGRRFAWQGAGGSIAAALRRAVEAAGGVPTEDPGEADVVVLVEPGVDLGEAVEGVIGATADRQLPPEVWALRASPDEPTARHYRTDVRVAFRCLLLPQAQPKPAAEAASVDRLARRALFWIRRDPAFVLLGGPPDLAAWRRHLAAPALAPPGARLVRHRMELLPAAIGEEPAARALP